MKKLLLLLLVVVFGVLAVMFDWFGSRDIAQSGVEATQGAVERVEEAGNTVSETFRQFNQNQGEKN